MNYIVSLAGQTHQVSVGSLVTIEHESSPLDISRIDENTFSVLIRGEVFKVVVCRNGNSYSVLLCGRQYDARVESERDILLRKYSIAPLSAGHRLEIHAPMPALVVRVEVSVGEEVAAGQGLVVLEAMKMENEIKAPQAGKVKDITVVKGKTVEKGELLVLLE
jgi:acetyl/propionyl-CoA carboxylase alpha subunit